MLSNSLINFLLLGRAVSLPIIWPEAKLCRGNGCHGDLFQNDLCQPATAPRTVVQCPIPRSRPLSTHASARDPGHPQASLAQSFVGFLLLSPGSWCTWGFFFVPFNSLFPQACASSVIKSHWSPKSNSMCSQSLCQTPRLGNLLWVLELLQQCENFFGYNCSPVCGSSSQWLCGGAKGNLLARQLMMCAMPPRSAAARTPVPMADNCRRHSNTQHRSDSVSVGSPYCKIQT